MIPVHRFFWGGQHPRNFEGP